MSRFVSSGTDQEPTERDEAWKEAQKAVEARHLAKLEAGRQEGGKSLYETLQANKDAKQEAFEESIRLRNQFRSLDDDEIEFLESVNAESRAKEEEARRETREQLELFRQQREDAEKAAKQNDSTTVEAESIAWNATSRKRKKQKELPGIVKKRQASHSTETKNDDHGNHDNVSSKSNATPVLHEHSDTSKDIHTTPQADTTNTISNSTITTVGSEGPTKPLLGLADYSSDEE